MAITFSAWNALSRAKVISPARRWTVAVRASTSPRRCIILESRSKSALFAVTRTGSRPTVPLTFPFVLAAFRVYAVAPLAGLSENRDLDIFQQARRIILEVRRFRCFHGKKLLRSQSFRESKPTLLPDHALRRWRRSLCFFSMRHP